MPLPRPATVVRRLAVIALAATALARADAPAAPVSPAPPAQAEVLGQARPLDDVAERFDRVWRLVDERYWDLPGSGVDWNDVREPYRSRALAAENEEALHEVLGEMVDLLADDHSRYVPPREVQRVREQYGDLPCIGVFGRAQGQGASGPVRWRIESGVGVIVLPDLAQEGAAAGVRRAAAALETAQAQALVLDVRGNPGGRLVEMMAAAGAFTDGFLWRVATTWSFPLPYPAVGATVSDLPLAVLVDGDVHSAAEGLAGALQASGRALVVGSRTAGNVEAVLPFCLRDGSQVWLATGVLAPLRGPTWEGRGVEPDLAVPPERALEAAVEALLDGR